MRLNKHYKSLTSIINSADKAMLDSMPTDMYDDEFAYVMSRLQLRMAHTICRLLPIPKEDDEDEN